MNRNFSALTAMLIVMALVATIFGCILREPVHSFAQTGPENVIYLTFDDGPSDRVTPKILDVLKAEKVPATFFIVGKNAELRREILKRAHNEGHTLAVHSYSHEYSKIYSSKETLLADIEKCNEIISSITGEFTSVYRFPGGSFTVAPELIQAVSSAGYRYVDWNASFRDSELRAATAEDLFNAAVSTVAHPQSVIMLAHDTTEKSTTVEALKSVISHFKSKGYTFKAF